LHKLPGLPTHKVWEILSDLSTTIEDEKYQKPESCYEKRAPEDVTGGNSLRFVYDN